MPAMTRQPRRCQCAVAPASASGSRMPKSSSSPVRRPPPGSPLPSWRCTSAKLVAHVGVTARFTGTRGSAEAAASGGN